jgi:hypothetical protein
MPPAGAAAGGRFPVPLAPGIVGRLPHAEEPSMRRGVELLLIHTTLSEDRPSARMRLRAVLGDALATMLVRALSQRRADTRRSSAPYKRM